MGRIKTAMIKKVTNQLIKENKDQFKPNFIENKKIVTQFAKIPNKKLRNIIAGYITRLMKQKK